MGIQINGNTDTITAIDGALTVSGAELSAVTNLNATGIVTASGFVGNITGNVNSSGVSTIATLNVAQSNPTRLNVSGVSTFSGGVVISSGSASSPSISPSGDSNTGIFFPSPDTIAFAEGGVEALRIDSSGRVGVGTDNPQYALDVFSSPNTDPYAVIRTVSSTVGGFLAQGTTQAHYRFVTGGQWDDVGAKKWQIRVGAGSGIDDFRVYSWTKSDDVMRINNSGHLLTPYQPCWNVGRNSIQTISNGTATNIIFNQSTGNDCFLQGGCTLDTSTGRVTVPVGGKYLLVASIRTEDPGASTGTNLQFQRNGTTLQRYYVGTGSANSGGNYMYINPMPYIATASANDYFELRFDSVVGTFNLSAANNTVVRFMGYLIG